MTIWVAASSGDGTYTLRASVQLWTHNAERTMHWAKHGELTRMVRRTFCVLAKQAQIPALRSVHITAQPYQQRGRLADPGAHQPAVKAAIDGLVDAGVLEDDSGLYVASLRHLPPLRATGSTDELELTLSVAAEGPKTKRGE